MGSTDHALLGVDVLVEHSLDVAAGEVALHFAEKHILAAGFSGVEVFFKLELFAGLGERPEEGDAVDKIYYRHEVLPAADESGLPREAVFEERHHFGDKISEFFPLAQSHQRHLLLRLHLSGPFEVVGDFLADVILISPHHLQSSDALLRGPKEGHLLLGESVGESQFPENPPGDLDLSEQAGEDGAIEGMRLLSSELSPQFLHK